MTYELLYIIPQQVKDEEIPSITKKVDETIKEVGGRITKEENLGKKKLAYLIKQTRRGFYILINFELSPSALQELKEDLRLMEEILRFQIIKKEKRPGKKISSSPLSKGVRGLSIETFDVDELNKELLNC
jgi:small subunit ribosomal protein S6